MTTKLLIDVTDRSLRACDENIIWGDVRAGQLLLFDWDQKVWFREVHAITQTDGSFAVTLKGKRGPNWTIAHVRISVL